MASGSCNIVFESDSLDCVFMLRWWRGAGLHGGLPARTNGLAQEELTVPALLLALAFAALVAYEVPGIIRRREWRELMLFLVLVLFGFVVSFLQAIGVRVPNPVRGIQFLTGKVAGLFE